MTPRGYAVLASLFTTRIANDIMRGFELMAIAEEEIARAFPRVDGKPTDPPGLFRATCIPSMMRRTSEHVYLAHVRELVKRAQRDGARADFSLATDAEVLCAILSTAQATPLNHDGQMLAERLFLRVFPGRDFGSHAEEKWSGHFEEVLADARRRTKTERAYLHSSCSRERLFPRAVLAVASHEGPCEVASHEGPCEVGCPVS